MRIILAYLCIPLFFAGSVALAAESNPPYRFYFAQATENDIPSSDALSDFECSQRIFAVAEFFAIERGPHSLVTQWFDPLGKKREQAESVFFFKDEPSRVWAWLKLHRPTGGALISLIDGAYGMEDFIGNWKVKFFLDKKPLQTLTFSVLC